jgi:actin-related protein
MEINIKEIFNRTDLRHIIRNFILTEDIDHVKIDNLSHEQRLEEGRFCMLERIDLMYENNKKEHDEAVEVFEFVTIAYRDVFFEMGMKVGAQLAFQLLCQGN